MDQIDVIGPVIGPYGNDTEAMAQEVQANASNITTGNSNPTFAIADFLAMYPQFGGVSVATMGTVNANQLLVASNTGITQGMLIADPSYNIPDGTIVVLIQGTTITMSNPAAIATTTESVINFYTPMVPIMTLQMFIMMATNYIQQARWHSVWKYAMCLFVAHFSALFLQTQIGPNSTAAQVIATSQTMFPSTSESAGDVSGSFAASDVLGDLPGWAQWKLTQFGVQLASFAKLVGKGGMVV